MTSWRSLFIGVTVGLIAATGGAYALRPGPPRPILAALPVGAAPDGYVVAAYQPAPTGWRVLDPRTGTYVARDGSFAAPSPDLRYILTYEAGSLSRSTRVLETGTGAVVRDLGRDWNLPLGWSRDGRHIVVAGAVFHRTGSREDDYFTVDRVRVFDVVTGRSANVAGWASTRTFPDVSPWWTVDGRLVYGDRLIAMDGSVTVSRYAAVDSRPVLGTDQVRSVVYGAGYFVLGEHSGDIVTGTTRDAAARELDGRWLGLDAYGFEWIAWLDDDRVVGLRDHDIAVYDIQRQTRQVLMAFPDLVLTGVLLAPAVGVPATIR